MKYLLDSDVLIYAARPEPLYSALRSWIERPDTSISAISLVEVLGFARMEAEDAVFFSIAFDFLPQLSITADILNKAVEVRRLSRLKTPDAIVAATALEHNLRLITADRDFARVVGLVVINPLRP